MSIENNFSKNEVRNLQEIDIEVLMNEWKISRDGLSIGPIGLGPCTGIILYDPVTKIGVAGHFVMPTYGDANEMFHALPSIFEDMSRVKVYLGGAEAMKDGMYVENRQSILESISQAGVNAENIYIEWLDPGHVTSMRLEPETGIVTYDTCWLDELQEKLENW